MSGSAEFLPGTFAENSALRKDLEADTDANTTFAKELANTNALLEEKRVAASTAMEDEKAAVTKQLDDERAAASTKLEEERAAASKNIVAATKQL